MQARRRGASLTARPALESLVLPGYASASPQPSDRKRTVLLTLCKGKLHRATVTRAELHYVGRITIAADLSRHPELAEE